MRIIHCAPFNIVTKLGASLYSNPVKISHGLTYNDHFVHNFDYRDIARYYSILKSKRFGATKMNQLFLECIDSLNPDLIIFGHGELISEDTFYYIKKKNIKMILWYNDMVIDTRLKNIGHLLDLVLITGAGKIIDQLRQFNENTFFLPNPVDKNMEKYHAFSTEQPYDILFSGRNDIERSQLIQFITTHLSQYHAKFIGQNKATTVLGDDYFKLITNSKICLNHNREEYMAHKWYTSDRLMHILGNGSFCLSRPIIGGKDFFEDKLEYYNTFEEMESKIEYYLNNKEERISKSIWLQHRTHALFNTKRIGEYILHLLALNEKQLHQYEWWK